MSKSQRMAIVGLVTGLLVILLWPKRGTAAPVAGEGGDNGPSSWKTATCQPYIDPQTGILTIPVCY